MERFFQWLALTTLLVLSGGCPEGSQPPRRAEALCPEGDQLDPRRAARLLGLLEGTPEGRDLLQRSPTPLRICFGDRRESGVTTEGVFLLDGGTGEAENAARLGHLLLHVVEGTLRLEELARGRRCEDVTRELVAGEARAHALELELRRALGVTSARLVFPFEQAYWAAPEGARVELVRTYLLAHPEGGEGLPGFFRDYQRRCAALDGVRREGGGPSGLPGRDLIAPVER